MGKLETRKSVASTRHFLEETNMGLDKKYRGQAVSTHKEIAKVVLKKYLEQKNC